MMKQDMNTKPIKEDESLQATVEWIIEEFSSVGIEFENKKKTPQNGEFSGIIGNRNEELKVNV